MPWCYYPGDSFNPRECEDDYMNCNALKKSCGTGTTNIYLGNCGNNESCSNTNNNQSNQTNPSNNTWSCKKRKCLDQPQAPAEKGFETEPIPRPKGLPPKECKPKREPTLPIDPDAVGGITRPIPSKEVEDLLETPMEGFEEPLGELTFEEIANEKDPGPFLDPIDIEEMERETQEEEEAESTLPPTCEMVPADPCCSIPNWWEPGRAEYYWIPSNISNLNNFQTIQGVTKLIARQYAPVVAGKPNIPIMSRPFEIGQGFYYLVCAWLFRNNPSGRTALDSLIPSPAQDPNLGTPPKLAILNPIAIANYAITVNPLTGTFFRNSVSMYWMMYWRNDVKWSIEQGNVPGDTTWISDSIFDGSWTPTSLNAISAIFPPPATLEAQWSYGGEELCSANTPPITGPYSIPAGGNPTTPGGQRIPKPSQLETFWTDSLDQSKYGGNKWRYYDEVYNWWFKGGNDPPNNGVDTITGPVHPTDDWFTATDIDQLELWFFGNRTTTPTYEPCPDVCVTDREIELPPPIPVTEEPPDEPMIDPFGPTPPRPGPFDPDPEPEPEPEPLQPEPEVLVQPQPVGLPDPKPLPKPIISVPPRVLSSPFTLTNSRTEHEMIRDTIKEIQKVPSVTSQDPDGIGWIRSSDWVPWDGIPLDIFNREPTKQQLCKFLAPKSRNAMRGLRERFYQVNPFKDVSNPTIEEIDAWNLEVIRHFRCLLGVTTPVWGDARLQLESRWADERKMTNYWDVKYPDKMNCNGGSCQGWRDGPCGVAPDNIKDVAGGHCGASFWPDKTDRDLYIANAYNNDFVKYPELAVYNERRSKAEGLNVINGDIPWSIKLSIIIMKWACDEGLKGHTGPYVGDGRITGKPDRTHVGMSWWHLNTPGKGGQLGYRGKWASNRGDYDPGPAKPNCV